VERDVGENWGERNFLERGFVRLVEDVRGAGLLWSPLMMEWFCPAFLTREREIGERIVGFQERDSLDQTSTFPPQSIIFLAFYGLRLVVADRGVRTA